MPRETESLRVVHLALRHALLRDDTLQPRKVGRLHTLKLFHVDEIAGGKQQHVVLAVRTYHARVVVLAPLGRKQTAYPRALALALTAEKYQHELVHLLLVQRAGHRAHQPAAETLAPELPVFRPYGIGQLADVVRYAVPRGKIEQIILKGIERRGVVGVDNGLQRVQGAVDAVCQQAYVDGVQILAPQGAENGRSGKETRSARTVLLAELQTVQHRIAAKAVAKRKEIHDAADDGNLVLFRFLGRTGLAHVQVGVADSPRNVQVVLPEVAFGKEHGNFLRDVLTEAAVAQYEEEIVTVALTENLGTAGGVERLFILHEMPGGYFGRQSGSVVTPRPVTLLALQCSVIRRFVRQSVTRPLTRQFPRQPVFRRLIPRPFLLPLRLPGHEHPGRHFLNLPQQSRIQIRLRIERSEEAPTDILTAHVHRKSDETLHVQAGGLVHQRMMVLKLRVRDERHGEGHLAQTAGIRRAQVKEDFEAMPLGREEARHNVGVGLKQTADGIHTVVRQLVHVHGDDGVVAKQAVRLPQGGVVSRERKKRELLLDGVRFGEVAQTQLLLHFPNRMEVGAVANVGYHGSQVRFAGNGGEAAVSGNHEVFHRCLF